MKHIRVYENLVDEPKVGDYAICRDHFGRVPVAIIDYNLENFIGEIIFFDEDDVDLQYKIYYEDAGDWWWFYRDNIIYFSSNKEDLLIYIEANKYNI